MSKRFSLSNTIKDLKWSFSASEKAKNITILAGKVIANTAIATGELIIDVSKSHSEIKNKSSEDVYSKYKKGDQNEKVAAEIVLRARKNQFKELSTNELSCIVADCNRDKADRKLAELVLSKR